MFVAIHILDYSLLDVKWFLENYLNRKGGELMIYRNIVALCKKNSISISRLEKEVNLGNGTIGRWRESSPNIESLKAVADYFGVSVDTLISGAPES